MEQAVLAQILSQLDGFEREEFQQLNQAIAVYLADQDGEANRGTFHQ